MGTHTASLEKYFNHARRQTHIHLALDELKRNAVILLVIKHTRTELVLNKSYQELAEHYGTAIMPTRVRAPKDKATVEGSVGKISIFILAAIRNQKFFSLRELNEVIRERLHAFNHKPFQRKEGSRAVWFADEKPALLPLPPES